MGETSQRAEWIEAVLDVLAPQHATGVRLPIFEWAHEETPTDDEMADLAGRIVDAVSGVGVSSQPTT